MRVSSVLCCVLVLGIYALTYATPLHSSNLDTQVPQLIDTRIVGGKVVDIAMHPHLVSLRFKTIFTPEEPYVHRCGGSIYSARVIITAARCIIGSVPSQYKVVAGNNIRTGMEGVIVPVQEIIIHERYDRNKYDYDIGILILAEPLPLNNFNMKAIELADAEVRNGATSIVTGWGAISEGGSLSDLLQEVRVPIVSNEICNEDYEGRIKDSMLCAGVRGVGGKDACQGDTGGPLLVNRQLAGVMSWGYGCAQPKFPGVYANVTYLRPWLLEKIQEFERSEIAK